MQQQLVCLVKHRNCTQGNVDAAEKKKAKYLSKKNKQSYYWLRITMGEPAATVSLMCMPESRTLKLKITVSF